MTYAISIELPETLIVGGPNGQDKEFSTANWTAEFILENALHGLKQRRSDKLSVTKAQSKLDDLDAKILAGANLGTGGRGPSGSRLGKESEALHQFLVAKGKKGKKGDLDERLIEYIEVMVLNAEDLPEDIRKELRKPENRNELRAAAEERYDDAIEAIKASKLYAAKLASIEAEEEAEEIVVKTAPGMKVG